MKRSLGSPWVALGFGLFFGCATKSLPPGTPPPEYEKRAFDPWPPTPLDAGVEASEVDAAPVPPDAASPDDASPDHLEGQH